jgi:diguanylate cyclase (GGDEF)-like protein/PAS domain S-box-containing protein
MDRLVTVAYPLMDILLVVVIVHAVFTLPRWSAAAWLLFAGLATMMLADALYARAFASGGYADGSMLDALWPLSYILLAGAAMHPSMRQLWDSDEVGIVRHGRARMVVLGTALFAVPAVVLLDSSGSATAVVLALITAIAAVAVAWRIMGLVDESNRSRVVLAESEGRFRALVQHAADIIVVLQPDGTVTYVSPAVEATFGLAPTDVVGRSFDRLLDATSTKQVHELIHDVVADPDQTLSAELHVSDGTTWHWLETTWTNQLDEAAVAGIVCNFREITERKRTAAFAETEADALEMILSGKPVPSTLTTLLSALERYVPDGVGSIRLLDLAAGPSEPMATTTLPAEYLIRLSDLAFDGVAEHLSTTEVTVIRDFEAADGTDAELAELCLAHGVHGLWSLPIRTPEGSEFLGQLSLLLRCVREPKAGELAVLTRVRDLAALAIDRDARTKELGHLALHDTLTGLPNRGLAQARLEQVLSRLTNDVDDPIVAVLFVDLDRFKLVNDGLGHETGDELLVAVSRRLSASVRSQDTIARLGGDEFVVLCEDLDSEHQAIELADRVAAAFAEPFALSRAEVTMSASIGIAVTNRSSDRAANLLQDADAAMYRAKQRGGARRELFDEVMHTQAVSRLLTERALRRALDHDELRVVFQPQFDLTSGRRVALEALLRWEHPVRGLVVPGDFLRVAEETGVIVPMGAWVLQRACELARSSRVHHSADGPLVVSTNVSDRQLQRPDFPEVVARAIADADIDPATLCLEVAESTLLDDLDVTGEALRELKEIGVRLAIDDFGTGGSSLTYLRRFPFDELKIDRMFIEGLGRSAADDAIVAATIDMAHALGMVVTAEGVESEPQRLRLRDLGCDHAQGYHLGAPEDLGSPHLVLVGKQPA